MPTIPKETPPRDPTTVATELGEVYYIRLDAETEQKELRNEYFEAATVAQSSEALAQKTVVLPYPMGLEEAFAFAEKYNSGWRVVKSTIVGGEVEKVVLEEDPNFKGHSEIILVPPRGDDDPGGVWDFKGQWHPGYVVTKTVRAGSALIDDERLCEEEPTLWEAITEYPNFDLYWEIARESTPEEEMEDKELYDWLVSIFRMRGLDPVLTDPKTWTVEEADAIRPYAYEGPKTLALNVRYAKDDEAPEEKD